MVFTVTQNNLGIQLLNNLLGNTAGLSNFSVRLTGDGRAFGTFSDDPFGLRSGVVLSTGKVVDLVGTNAADGGFSPGESVSLNFTKLAGITGSPTASATAVYRADLSGIGFDLRSISIQDSGSGAGGASGQFSGFDLDGIKFSRSLITNAADINALPSLNVFDFSPASTVLVPGTQRPGDFAAPDLLGTVNGSVNNAFATLSDFDAYAFADAPNGLVSLGDGGRIGFDLTSPIATSSQPLYLYIGEGGDNGEVAAGQISVSNRPLSGLSDLSTDFGIPGEENDTIAMEIQFDADASTQQVFFQFVFGSEELVEYGGLFNDAFRLELNGFNLAALSDGSEVTINNLVPSPFLGYNPDFIYSPVGTGTTSDRTRLDGFTKPLTFVGDVEPNTRNTLTITLQDNRDGLIDSAVFLRAGTLSIDPPVTVINPGGSTTIDIPTGGGTVVIDNFGGVGRGVAPSAETIAEVDTLRFTGAGLTARNLLLTQVGANLELTFAGIANTKVVLRNFDLENLDNLLRSTGATVDLGNILFDGDAAIADSYDVFNREWTFDRISNPNTVTFLNDLDNRIRGFDSNDVINAQGGVDRVNGGKGDDLLRGGAGTDVLRGGEGDDILIGDADLDLLSGDQGSDRFVIAAGAGSDIIEDFEVGIDTIGLADGLILADLAIVQGSGSNASNTEIRLVGTDEVLATLIGIQANTVTPISFVSLQDFMS